MPSERPLLVFSPPVDSRRETGTPPFFRQPRVPGRQRQVSRFSPQFSRLQSIIDRPEATFELQADSSGIAPDRALVFEVAGSVESFSAQARSAGFEFLGEIDAEMDPDEDFYMGEDDDSPVKCTLYLVMPDLRAMKELLSMWERYRKGEGFERGTGAWKAIFEQLYDIRPWGAADRETDGFKESFQLWAQSTTSSPFRFEIDLWYSSSELKRFSAQQDVETTLSQVGGRVLDRATISPIRYHGVLAEIPRNSAEFFASQENPILALDQIMYLNPRAMASCSIADANGEVSREYPEVSEPPVAVLLDGFPLANHQAISGRIVVDDFLGIEDRCPANRRHHGTAMASLIHHGDMNSIDEEPIKSKLLALPVLCHDPATGLESMPQDRLAIDVTYQGIIRLKEGTREQPAIGNEIFIVNHSLGDSNNPYSEQRISAWGKLLDHLSFKYQLLFIVSAGNHTGKIPLTGCPTVSDFEFAEIKDQDSLYHKGLAEDMRNRQLLPPAEALNPLTIGAWQADSCPSGGIPAAFIDVLPNQDGPSPITAVGLGHRRAVKPDFFYDGGRTLARIMPNGECCALHPVIQSTRYSGQKVATPSGTGELDKTTNLCGTSNAAALVTRRAIQLNEMLEELAEETEEANIPQSHKAVVVKALLAHGCEWKDRGDALNKVIEPQRSTAHEARKTNIARLIGMGRPDIGRVLECTCQRATMFGWSTIRVDRSQVFKIPLPESLSNSREARRLTLTLAWLTPINPRHQQYRQAVLELDADETQCGTKRGNVKHQISKRTIGRGTLIHWQCKGSKFMEFGEGLLVTVKCRQQAGRLDDAVPFAIVASFEVGEGVDIDVYEEIRTKLAVEAREPVRI